MKSEKKTILLLCISIVTTFLAMIGISYALFTTEVIGGKELVFQSGSFEITYQNHSNEIQLRNAYPMTESEGMTTEEYVFVIENTSAASAEYDIVFETDAGNTLSPEWIKIAYRQNDAAYSTPVFLNTLDMDMTLRSHAVLHAGKKTTYGLRLWLDASAPNEVQGQVFKMKIVVNASQLLEEN